MTAYLSPGVYIEEVPSANKAIQGASTSTAGMVGLTERGPIGVPTLVTSPGAFKRIFGGLLDPASYPDGGDALPQAVNGFFANGGTRIYVVRIIGVGASTAGVTINASAAPTLGVYARSEGSWGDALQVTVSHTSRFSAWIEEQGVGGDDAQLRLSSSFGLTAGTTLAIGSEVREVRAVLANNIVELTAGIAANLVTDAAERSTLEADVAAAQAALDAAIEADEGGDHSALETTLENAQEALVAALLMAAATSVEFDLTIEKMSSGVAVETELFTGLSLSAASPAYAPRVLGSCGENGVNPSTDGDSQMVRLFVPDGHGVRPDAGLHDLTGGSDGAVSPATYIGTPSEDPANRTGIQALANEPGISLVAIPGQTDVAAQNALLVHCEQQVYRFAVLDTPEGATLRDARDHRGEFDSTRAAIYYPWLMVPAPFGPRGEQHAVPPSGHVLGVYARTDTSRGVWKAPANEVLRNILGFDVTVNKGEQDILNPVHVNCLRDFRSDQRGLRIWGARTLSSDPEWKYVPVRRTFLMIQQSLDAGLQWAVFEPNAKPLWDTVRQSITGFLDSIWRQGGLAGVTQEQAFFVNVGYGITMEQADLDNGRLIVEVGIAPVYPAEFVIIRISQKTLEAVG